MKPYAGSDFEEQRGLTKKDRESWIIYGVLDRLGLSGFDLELTERPDALVDFRDARGSIRLGCEIMTLQADAGVSGSPLREFEARWIRIAERVHAILSADAEPVPYCTVWFREASYTSLRQVCDDNLVTEFVVAGRRLRNASSITFHQDDTPTLNTILTEMRVVHSDGQGCLWWPTHLKSGAVPPLDGTIVNAIKAKTALAASFDWSGSDERWLLLVAEARGLTDVIGGAREVDLPTDLTVPFTWVLVWDRFSEDIWTVFPHYAIICDGYKQVRKPLLLPERLHRFCTGGEIYLTKPKAR